ncbi:DUF1257 domain-containing protein [Cylindrospermum sp. FACHB-282]|uniref:DUF1257 domain-containing protein n=1 Tax=Cylindrospermum sp. FACHB-282 TaxID=2692794 RepID=UPI001684233F|nr:DUF1257 domain-containing protein [Cylindrospermum sp. FACHB-282]MBD2386033.1 DUF1257 domain-containing protein [Cylindrospermum sp. FACHB-282]
MSHLSHIKTTIKNAQVLESVLSQMITDGLDGILTGAKLGRNVTEHEFDDNGTVDFVIRRTQKANWNDSSDFGFRKVEEAFEFLSFYGARDSKKFIQSLTPWYARENAIAALVSQGFNIDEITEENGEIKILAGKWG